MFQPGDQLLYGIHGVCTVTAIESMRFDKTRSDYYCLQPLAQPDSKFYVPVNNPSAIAKLRPLISRNELSRLLTSDQVRQNLWVADEHQRRGMFRDMIARADRAELLSMIRCLLLHRNKQLRSGRKFHQADENFLKDAEKLICAEVSHVMDMTPTEAEHHIRTMLLSDADPVE